MKPSSKIPLLAAAVVVLAIIAGTFIMRGRDKAVADGEAGQVVDETSTPPATTTGAPPRAATPAGARAAASDRINDRVADHVERREQMREAHEARAKALREQSAQRFASEQVDPAWAPQKESELNGLANQPGFQTAGVQPQNLSVDCRSSMCRIDGQFESSGKAEDWLLIYMSSVGSAMPNSVVSRVPNPDGSTRVEIYGRAR